MAERYEFVEVREKEEGGSGWGLALAAIGALVGLGALVWYVSTKKPATNGGGGTTPPATTTHKECIYRGSYYGWECAPVSNVAGQPNVDTCQLNSNCGPGGTPAVTGTHRECVGDVCTTVPNPAGVATMSYADIIAAGKQPCNINLNCTPESPVPSTIEIQPSVILEGMQNGGCCCSYCSGGERPNWEKEVSVIVRDQNGAGISGAVVLFTFIQSNWYFAMTPVYTGGQGMETSISCSPISILTDQNGVGKIRLFAIRDAGWPGSTSAELKAEVVTYTGTTGLPVATNPRLIAGITVQVSGRSMTSNAWTCIKCNKPLSNTCDGAFTGTGI